MECFVIHKITWPDYTFLPTSASPQRRPHKCRDAAINRHHVPTEAVNHLHAELHAEGNVPLMSSPTHSGYQGDAISVPLHRHVWRCATPPETDNCPFAAISCFPAASMAKSDTQWLAMSAKVLPNTKYRYIMHPVTASSWWPLPCDICADFSVKKETRSVASCYYILPVTTASNQASW